MTYSLEQLKYLMARLRNPDTGCPWDLQQTFHSIAPHTLEEAYEVADAIAREDYPHLEEELGDLLFQVVFYGELGREQGHFDFDSIVDQLVRKLIRRHPHVFPAGTLESEVDAGQRPDEAEIRQNWERIKDQERRAGDRAGHSAPPSRLEGIAASLPAMTRAEKLQRRAAQAGFDWPDVGPVFDKLHEETEELKQALTEAGRDPAKQEAVEDELGDLLFVCVNLARFMNVNPEQALQRTNRKFEARFRAIEQRLAAEGRTMEEEPLEALDRIWQAVKGVENS
ncbi:nucleoside triphosphate pyrophosphohydrolase [Marinobacter sp. X15-166B]|uniref:nucleoside triphosphate pyrophosphohydrolase n=1 Tax=Marinobacter sp. X15-166B TaxID=1897620 RepID=UPI00085C6397|nr:nucleoside triphosphate pyrophosphohydrolase [Marinobacter sp. X15-166B]OEY66915.1 nucleoside triphosphate pyrophosphohydrolase [Marinobacter sp. X15-166B]